MSEEITLAKKVHIYSNGDRFFTGRRFVINPRQTRNYESFLTQVTYSLKPSFGAVRVLRTPENGHPVCDLSDLETGRSYVACAQKFVKLGWVIYMVGLSHHCWRTTDVVVVTADVYVVDLITNLSINILFTYSISHIRS